MEDRLKILLVMAPSGYSLEIKKNLEKRHHVDHLVACAKPGKNTITTAHRILRSAVRDLHLRIFERYLESLEMGYFSTIASCVEKDYDLVLDVGGHAPKACLSLLKEKLRCPFHIYLWDDIKYNQKVLRKIAYFDKVFSYNPVDSERFGFHFLPSFHADHFSFYENKKTVDIFYKGTLRNYQRSRIISKIKSQTSGLNTDITLYARGGYLRNIKRVPSREFFDSTCNNEYMDLREVSNRTRAARAILDLQFKGQVGLSPRSFEAIAAQCKIITTNENIASYDFYDEQNVLVLNDKKIDKTRILAFIARPLKPYSAETIKKYSVHTFLKKLLDQG